MGKYIIPVFCLNQTLELQLEYKPVQQKFRLDKTAHFRIKHQMVTEHIQISFLCLVFRYLGTFQP